MKTKDITIYAMYLAIFVIMSFVPYIGYIRFSPGLMISTMAVPVTVITVHKGWQGALYGSFLWGLLSIPAGIEYGSIVITVTGIWKGMLALFFSRILLGIILAGVILLLKKYFNTWIQLFVIGLLAAILNTILVILFLYIVGFEPQGIWAVVIASSVNIAVEWSITPFVSISFASVLKRIS